MSTPSTTTPTVTLNDGVEIPQLGFGTWQIPPADAATAVTRALEAGYRHIDTAAAYRNEAGVGQALRSAGLPREQVFITTKLWNADHDRAREALEHSLEELGIDRVDLYLIHWPVPSQDRYVEAWQSLVELREAGLTRSIGVSNFQPPHLQRIIDATGVVPSVDQIELHPYFTQAAVKAELERLGIHVEAWSPLAQGEAVEDPVLREIAAAHHKTSGQVTLRWHMQLGHIVFPKSVTPERIVENFDVFDFELSPEELDRISDLNEDRRIGPDPDTFVSP